MPPPIIVFGAFDRHNFGDLLFAHVAEAMLVQAGVDPARLHFAGLASRDLRPVGGHAVQALDAVVARLSETRASAAAVRPAPRGPSGSSVGPGTSDGPGAPSAILLHAGGELLACDAWQAAVMLQSPDGLQALLHHFASRPAERRAWVRATVGTGERMPYVVSRRRLPHHARVLHLGVGGVDLDRLARAPRAEVLRKLARADGVSVRDATTRAHLAGAAIDALLIPDPAVMVAELFPDRIGLPGHTPGHAPGHAPGIPIGAHAGAHVGTPSGSDPMGAAFARGYLAVQFSADFGDDATLDTIAAQLDAVAAATGLGIVFFRAGAAPWHDALEPYQRVAARMRTDATHVFESLDPWAICALIAHSRGFCGSSLHGRIVAAACARPRVTLCRAEPAGAADSVGAPTKHAAYVDTWDRSVARALVTAGGLAAAVREALGTDPDVLRTTATALAAQFRSGFARLLAETPPLADAPSLATPRA